MILMQTDSWYQYLIGTKGGGAKPLLLMALVINIFLT